MNKNAAFRELVNPRPHLAPVALLTAAALLLVAPGGLASAAPVGKDGKIHACYRVKGKPKGALRVVSSARARCRRGERKVAWDFAATSGQPAATTGRQGEAGANGSPGGAGADEAALQAKVSALTLKVESLEGALEGITNGDLTGLFGRVNGLEGVVDGVTNSQLQDAVDSLPAVDLLCEQTPLLAEQANLLQGVVGGLDLGGTLKTLGLLEIPDLPTELEVDEFGCSAP